MRNLKEKNSLTFSSCFAALRSAAVASRLQQEM